MACSCFFGLTILMRLFHELVSLSFSLKRSHTSIQVRMLGSSLYVTQTDTTFPSVPWLRPNNSFKPTPLRGPA